MYCSFKRCFLIIVLLLLGVMCLLSLFKNGKLYHEGEKYSLFTSRHWLNKTVLSPLNAWINQTEKLKRLPEWNKFILGYLPHLQDQCVTDMTFSAEETPEKLCPCFTERQQGHVPVDFEPQSLDVIMKSVLSSDIPGRMREGGHWTPRGCIPRQRVAVVVPYHDRPYDLHIFLNHILKVMMRQRMEYQIVVVEQANAVVFNKGALFNIGFLETMSIFRFDCIILHDVDMFMEDDRNLYACMKGQTRHMANSIDKHNYKIMYATYFGGVTAVPREIFSRIDGFANNFWGWGGEDDFFYRRVNHFNYKVHRQPSAIARFTALKHGHDAANPVNPFKMNQQNQDLNIANGLSTLKYNVHRLERHLLFTWMLVEPLSTFSHFISRKVTCEEKVTPVKRMPIYTCAEECLRHERCTHFEHDSEGNCTLLTSECEETKAPTLRVYYKRGRNATSLNEV